MSTPVQGQCSSVEATATPSGVTTGPGMTPAGAEDENGAKLGVPIYLKGWPHYPEGLVKVEHYRALLETVQVADRLARIADKFADLDADLGTVVAEYAARRFGSGSTSATPEGVEPSIEKEQADA